MGEILNCDNLMKNYTKLKGRCDPLWDTKLCWPSTDLNQTAELPCPDRKFDHQTAKRTCIPYNDGTGENRPIWTLANYSSCPDADQYEALFLAVARSKYKERDESIIEKRFIPQMWETKLLTLSQVTYFLSFIVLVIALSVFILFGKLRNARTRLHMHMLAALIMQVVMWLMHSVLFDNQLLEGYMFLDVLSKINIQIASDFSEEFGMIIEEMFTRFESHLSYITIAGLERYFETATLFWLLMEGWFLFELICLAPLETKTSIKRYVIIGWGVPVIVTAPWMIDHLVSSFNDVYWVKHNITVYIVAGSIFMTYMINLYFFIAIVRVLYTKIKISFQLQQKKMEYKKWVRSTFILVLLFGAQNALYCVWFFIKKTKPKLVFLLIIKVISSFQGCFVSFIYCFLNKEVQTVLRKSLCD